MQVTEQQVFEMLGRAQMELALLRVENESLRLEVSTLREELAKVQASKSGE